jgi:GNAT superfamily N-acetyltransferase
MLAHDFAIHSINLRSASDHEYACLNAFKNILRGEALPEDPPLPYDEDVQRWRTMPDFIEEATWAVWDGGAERIIACGDGYIFHTGDNEHAIDFNIEVLPEYRRKGLGRRLLGLVVEVAHKHKRRLMISSSNDRVPAADAFFTKMGTRQALVSHTNQLRLAELDRTLIERWMAQSDHLFDNFDIGLWDKAYPEDQIVAIARLIEELAKDEPRDDLELEDFKITPDILRQWEHSMFATGTKR